MIRQFAVILVVSVLSMSAYAEKKVLMMVPDDFMWPEYQLPRAAYEKAGFKVTVAAKSNNEVSPDKRNKTEYIDSKAIKPDLSFDEVDVSKFDAVSFVAGNGAWHDFFPNPTVHTILKQFISQQKITALLCASTGLLALAENFDGKSKPFAEKKRVVGYYKVEGLLKNLGHVQFVEGKRDEVTVVKDGLLITGRNPQSAQKFAEEVVKALR